MAAAAATFNEPNRPRRGMAATTSQRWRTNRDKPAPSAPRTSATGPVATGSWCRRRRAAAVEAHDPDAGGLQALERRRQPADEGDGQVLDGAGGGLRDRGGHVHRPVAGQHDPGGAGALGRAKDRAEVAGVGDAVDDHQERRRLARVGDDEVVEIGLG